MLAVVTLFFVAVISRPLKQPVRLTYFSGENGALKGRAEKIRLMFRATNHTDDLIDIRIKGDKWKGLKSKTPFGKLPIMRHDKVKIGESVAIMRYCAHHLNLESWDYGKQAKTLSIALAAEDMRVALSKVRETPTEFRSLLSEQAKILEKNFEAEGDYLIGNDLSYADISVYDMFEQNLVDHLKIASPVDILRAEFQAPRLAKMYQLVAEKVGATKLSE